QAARKRAGMAQILASLISHFESHIYGARPCALSKILNRPDARRHRRSSRRVRTNPFVIATGHRRTLRATLAKSLILRGRREPPSKSVSDREAILVRTTALAPPMARAVTMPPNRFSDEGLQRSADSCKELEYYRQRY